MPFKSEAQRRYMQANLPDVAAEFEASTPKGVRLPAKVKKPRVDDASAIRNMYPHGNHGRGK